MTRRRFGSFVLAFCFAATSSVCAAPGLKDRDLAPPFLKWTETKDFESNEAHDPLVVKDIVLVGTDKGDLRAYRCGDGKSVWIHAHGQRIFHRPCSDGVNVYLTSDKGLTAVALKDGSEVWSFNLACCDGPTIVLNQHGLVYVGGHDGNLYALDTKTGKQRWTSDFITDAPPDRPGFAGERARMQNTRARPSALASDADTLFLSVFDQSRVVAVNATTGKRLWAIQVDGWVYGPAVATDKHVYFGSQDKAFYCLDKKTGKEVWKHRTKGRIESGGAVDDKFVYIGSCDGHLYCLSQSDGKERWKFATDSRPEGGASAIYSVPILRRGAVCFAAGEGQAYSVDLESGKLNWKFRPSDGSAMYCSPATNGEHIFLVTRPWEKGRGVASLVAIGFK